MSKIQLFDSKKQKPLAHLEYNSEVVNDFILNNLDYTLGLTLIFKDYQIKDSPFSNDAYKINMLCYDDTYRLVLIEIRKDKEGALVNQSFLIIDYIKENPSKIKLILSEYLNSETLKYINLNPRLIVIGEEFNDFDKYAIFQMPYEVCLIKIVLYKDYFILSKAISSHRDFVSNIDKITHPLFLKLHEKIKSIDESICCSGNHSLISYRSLKNFCLMIIKDVLLIKVGNEITEVNNKNFNKVMKTIINAYEK